ncbi:hypothetical protein BDN67DRAFT_1008120 [Paxillus ammoniavirescens]|nr:hypothetical protein BDN67DRAFT_1008120 [Paxillus ammoniavirescens]
MVYLFWAGGPSSLPAPIPKDAHEFDDNSMLPPSVSPQGAVNPARIEAQLCEAGSTLLESPKTGSRHPRHPTSPTIDLSRPSPSAPSSKRLKSSASKTPACPGFPSLAPVTCSASKSSSASSDPASQYLSSIIGALKAKSTGKDSPTSTVTPNPVLAAPPLIPPPTTPPAAKSKGKGKQKASSGAAPNPPEALASKVPVPADPAPSNSNLGSSAWPPTPDPPAHQAPHLFTANEVQAFIMSLFSNMSQSPQWGPTPGLQSHKSHLLISLPSPFRPFLTSPCHLLYGPSYLILHLPYSLLLPLSSYLMHSSFFQPSLPGTLFLMHLPSLGLSPALVFPPFLPHPLQLLHASSPQMISLITSMSQNCFGMAG